MQISIVDVIEFITTKSEKEDTKFSTYWTKPFLNYDKAYQYALDTLSENGFKNNGFITNFIDEDKYWKNSKLIEPYTFIAVGTIEATEKDPEISLHRFQGYRVMVEDEETQVYKKLVITIQTQEVQE